MLSPPGNRNLMYGCKPNEYRAPNDQRFPLVPMFQPMPGNMTLQNCCLLFGMKNCFALKGPDKNVKQ